MGEEWGADEPFPFFCDFKGDLAEAVRQGRRKEFAEAFATADDIPDPLAETTVRLATLDWGARRKSPHRERLDLVKRLLAVRNKEIVPLLPNIEAGTATARFDNELLVSAWRFRGDKILRLVANLSDDERPRPSDAVSGEAIWGGPAPARLPPWSVHVSLDRA
jgi:maltooligosyltrehalose trehalohydrolase